MIPVTKPFLPPKEKYVEFIRGIWQRNWLTNHGPLVNELELKLKEYLGLDHLLFLSNGTIALQIAIKALDLTGEVITTPFSYIATTSSLIWEGCTPVFVDIDPQSLNIDPNNIEAAISEKTCAILATHVYGNPCDVEAIDTIAKKYKLKVIYDAAHCFGTKYNDRSILCYGHISTISFHATKLFHTVEGGATITNDSDLLKKMASLRNFGHDGPYNFTMPGINGKNSEFHAAMGLCNLLHIDQILKRRKLLSQHYYKKLSGLNLQHQLIHPNGDYNYSYYPVIFENTQLMLKIGNELERNYIYTRRYFYPSLNKLSYLGSSIKVPISEDISSRILCLPLYHTLSYEEINTITRIISRSIKYK